MKKKNLKSLKLNRKLISNLKVSSIKGGGISFGRDDWFCAVTDFCSIVNSCQCISYNESPCESKDYSCEDELDDW